MRALCLAFFVLVGTAMAGRGDELDMLPLGDPDRAFDLGSATAGSFYDCRAGAVAGFDQMIDAFAEARVVLLGEEHTRMATKRDHAQVLEALAARGVPLVLGMEFFQRSDHEALQRWSAGEIDRDEMLRLTEWYDRGGYRFEYYELVMQVARQHGIPVVGLNVPREILRSINRGGLESLSEEQSILIGDIDVSASPQHRYLVGRYFGETVAMMPPSWFDNMYAAQCTWDVVMARSILDNLPPEATMVVVVGTGHVAFGLGIARRLDEELAARGAGPLRIATFCPVTAPAPEPDSEPAGHPMGGMRGMGHEMPATPARFVRSLADWVGAYADNGGIEAFPRLGVKLAEDEEHAAVVSIVFPDTLAERAGVKRGDRIIDLNGRVSEDLSHLRRMLAGLQWGERVDLRLARGEAILDVAALLLPEVRSVEETVAPGWSVRPVAPFDAAGPGPVVVQEEEPGLTRVLVEGGGLSPRVEVRRGELLLEVHELDDALCVRRSLFVQPLADGTVEVRFERNEEGTVVAEERLDRCGNPVKMVDPLPQG